MAHPLRDIVDDLTAGRIRWRAAVARAVRCIPPGKVLGYGHVATLLGNPRAARQVGYALAALGEGGIAADGEPVPWWRVTRSDGTVAMQGDVDRGPTQVAALKHEGVVLKHGKLDMRLFRWDPPAF